MDNSKSESFRTISLLYCIPTINKNNYTRYLKWKYGVTPDTIFTTKRSTKTCLPPLGCKDFENNFMFSYFQMEEHTFSYVTILQNLSTTRQEIQYLLM